ncbi:MAG: tRNA pseudouridine(13) synthase TruD [Candidatus Aminicenantia bacterium]
MGSDLIKSNFFIITIRNILNKELIYKNLEEIKNFEVANYFDVHRFRSYDRRWVFVAKILKKHWNGAIQVFLTSIFMI